MIADRRRLFFTTFAPSFPLGKSKLKDNRLFTALTEQE